ncbi:MAG TPA: hypothetical protein VFU23_12015 [Gemmatimonadales bacterium]|nr:hypothetical protein [Gemmatimonadales bacterium]
MRYQGFTIFVLFFALSLLDALWGGHWIRAFFWIAIGLAFVAMDRIGQARRASRE